MDDADDNPHKRPSSNDKLGCDSGFHDRLADLVKEAGSLTSLAKQAGMSQSGLHRIAKGGEPGLRSIIAIANGAGIRVEWLATGQGSKWREEEARELYVASHTETPISTQDGRVPLDIVESAVSTVERWLEKSDLEMDPDAKGRSVALLCKILWDARKSETKPDLEGYLKLVVG